MQTNPAEVLELFVQGEKAACGVWQRDELFPVSFLEWNTNK